MSLFLHFKWNFFVGVFISESNVRYSYDSFTDNFRKSSLVDGALTPIFLLFTQGGPSSVVKFISNEAL